MRYTGIGSRETPPAVLLQMEDLAYLLGHAGWTLRSGGARGADSAFEQGAERAISPREIYLPTKGFGQHASPLFGVCDEALARVKAVHPAWERCSEFARKLHGRNVYQVLGRSFSEPSALVICWTPDGCEDPARRSRVTGGTATAIALAHAAKIPVFNLRNERSCLLLEKFLAKNGVEFNFGQTQLKMF